MIEWLYRYIFRGIGIVFWIGILTGLFLILNQFRHMAHPPAAPHVSSGQR
jgi:hypothetical protein